MTNKFTSSGWMVALALVSLSISTQALQLDARQLAARHFARASLLAKQHKLPEAEQEYRAGLKLDPTSVAAYNNLGVLYFESGDFQRSINAFSQALRFRPGNADISFNLGLALFKTGNSKDAIAHLNDGLILFLLFNDYRKIGERAESLRAAAELLKSSPDSFFVYEMLGEAHDAAGQPREAEIEFKQAIAASPHAPQLHFLLGYLYWRWKHYEQAVAPLKDETRINPAFAPPYYYLGDIALKQRQLAQALTYFQKARSLDPTYAQAVLGIGRAYEQLGQYQKALGFLRSAAEKMPDNPEAHYWLGRTLIHVGRVKEGEEELAEVNRIDSARQQQARDLLNRAPEQPRQRKSD